MAWGPKCLNIIGDMLSGPKALELLVDFMASLTLPGVNWVNSSTLSLCIDLNVLLIDLSGQGG